MFSRQDYMNGVCDHNAYYDQFVNSWLLRLVSQCVGVDKIKASTDPHFNDIRLSLWDGLATDQDVINHVGKVNEQVKAWGDGKRVSSLSDRVCALKAAARWIKEGRTA